MLLDRWELYLLSWTLFLHSIVFLCLDDVAILGEQLKLGSHLTRREPMDTDCAQICKRFEEN